VLGNLLAMPVMGFWVMPAAALSVAAMPFGLEAPPLHLLGGGIDAMLAVGRFVSGLPGALSLAPAMPLSALIAISFGGLWLAIWRGPVRAWGVAPLLAGAALALAAPRPDMLVAADAQTVAIRGGDGLLHFLRPPKDRFAAQEWLRRDGDGRMLRDAVGLPGLRCDEYGCAMGGKTNIAAAWRPEALGKDCTRAAVLISAVPGRCRGPVLTIDRTMAQRDGGYRITLSAVPAAFSVREARGTRPWSAIPPR
jgi:competence protein ComEC